MVGDNGEEGGELLVVGEAGRHRALACVLVEERGGQGKGAGGQRLVERAGDGPPLRLGRRAFPGGLSHHPHPQRGVPDLGGEIDTEPTLAQDVPVLGVRRPAPVDRFVEDVGG